MRLARKLLQPPTALLKPYVAACETSQPPAANPQPQTESTSRLEPPTFGYTLALGYTPRDVQQVCSVSAPCLRH